MKQLRKFGALLLVAALILSTLFIPEQAKAVTKYPGLKESSIRLRVGESKKLTLVNSKGLKVKFKSYDKSIATVSQKGKVKAKKEGRTTIGVTIDGKWRRSCTVFVDPKLVAEKTVQHTVKNDGSQCQIRVIRTVKDVPFEITISTESEDENLKLKIFKATSGNKMSKVGTIDLYAKELTLTASNTIIITNETDTPVDVTITVKTQDGKKTISRVTIADVK